MNTKEELIEAASKISKTFKRTVMAILENYEVSDFPLPERWFGSTEKVRKKLQELGILYSIEDPDEILNTRARNVLCGMEVTSRMDAVRKITSGVIDFRKARLCGVRSRRLICKWAGVPDPLDKVPKTCPHCGGSLGLFQLL